jgi:hypothetical protein
MANWTNPLVTSQYDTFVVETKDRDVDCATMFINQGINVPNGSIRWNRVTSILEQFDATGVVWVPLVLGITGGGTGANNPNGIRVALGLGTMSVQNSNAISISAGVITGLSQFMISCSLTFSADNSFDIGSYAQAARKGYFKGGLVIPNGVDMFVTS